MTNNSRNLKKVILAALMAAVTVVCTWINVPLPFTPVPINMAVLAVFLSGGLLGAYYGLISQAVYIMCGLIGLPVFSGFRGGPSVLVGPTGGYIVGYLVCSFIVGLLIKESTSIIKIVVSLIIGLAACYALGTIWFVYSSETTLWGGLVSCVFPFIPGDIIKIILATILIKKLQPLIKKELF